MPRGKKGYSTETEKECATCKEIMPLRSFSSDASRWDKKDKQCIACSYGRTKIYRNTKVTPEKKLQYFLQSNHRIKPEQYQRLIDQQGGLCAICGADGKLFIDHDHLCCPMKGKACGKCIRGLLCHMCNTAIGLFRDDPEIMESAIKYIKEAKYVQF